MARPGLLIIEPDVAIAHLFAEAFGEEGYAVVCATSQDGALALLATAGPGAFSVVLSYAFVDRGEMPYAWIEQVGLWTQAPIVICTRFPATLYADHQARGYAAVVEEPCDLREVLDVVAALCPGADTGTGQHSPPEAHHAMTEVHA